MAAPPRWNHNIHYHPLVLGAVPAGARRALDVGCGEGMLVRALHRTVPEVIGLDPDRASLAAARGQDAGAGTAYVRGDLGTHPFADGSLDLVASVATLHHMDAEQGLTRMRDLLRPGGRLVVVGLAYSGIPADLPRELASAVAHRVHVHLLRKGYWEHPSPMVWPPPLSYREIRELAARVLPGVEYRRHLLWRYSLSWTKPA